MDEWINTKEKLPEIEKDVLVSFQDENYIEIGCITSNSDGSLFWVGSEWTSKLYGVAYWMPLPEPPNESNPD